MTEVLPAILVAFVLSGPLPSQSPDVTCDTGVRHIELPAVRQGEPPSVCISPGRPTLFSFDTDLMPGTVSLEGADRFTRVEPGPSTLKLLPSVMLATGERLRLTVTFKDNAAPTSAAFMLAVQAAQAEPLVNVYRRVRSAESYEQELEELRAKVRQLSEETTRLRVENDGPGGLIELLASGVMDGNGVLAHDITRGITRAVANRFKVSRVIAYRSANRVVVEMSLAFSEDAPPWKPESVTLTLQEKNGVELKVLTVWPSEPIAPSLLEGKYVRVEAEAPQGGTAGTYTLKASDASGARTITIGGITFP